jgi:hypothetical protein
MPFMVLSLPLPPQPAKKAVPIAMELPKINFFTVLLPFQCGFDQRFCKFHLFACKFGKCDLCRLYIPARPKKVSQKVENSSNEQNWTGGAGLWPA